MKRWSLLFYTIRHLKVSQLAYQVYYRIRKPRLRDLPEPTLRNQLSEWRGVAFQKAATVDGKCFTFLGQTARFEGNWNGPSFPKLWLYNLHYQDDLNAKGAESRFELCERMVDAWIEGNPPLKGNGWDPYCLSLRIVNWVKFFSRLGPGEVKRCWIRSLAQQADALEQQLEFHILANHLFANAKALVFVGAYLGGAEGDRWLRKGLALLDREMEEQFLNDGAHYERSPMYQGTLLWDLADLVALSHAVQLPGMKQRERYWKQRFEKGLEWLGAMTHPDGRISFFKDAAFGIAPDIEALKRYAGILELSVPQESRVLKPQSVLLRESGYAVVDWPDQHRLLVDLALVGPDYQPGHAHADTLSCELSLFGQRVLVNSGISQYGEGAERHRQRSTAAHNTVEVDGENSTEVWAGFRVARRAKPFNVSLEHGARKIVIEGSHDGYFRLRGKVTHRRSWFASDSALIIKDSLTGHYSRSVAHWHFHPDVTVEEIGRDRFQLSLPGGQHVLLVLEGAEELRVEDSVWHPELGRALQNKVLMAEISGDVLSSKIYFKNLSDDLDF